MTRRPIGGLVALASAVVACAATPTPSPSLPTVASEVTICDGVGLNGVLTGSPSDPRLAWLVEPDGRRRDIVWQPGYTATFGPQLAIHDATGRVVYRAGDHVTGGCAISDSVLLVLPPGPPNAPVATAVVSPSEAAASCTAASLAVHGGRMGGGTGTTHGDVFFTNIGTTPCTLSGAPIGIALLRSDGTVLPLVPQQPDPVSLGPVVTLAPGAKDAASIAFNWSNWCSAAPGPLRVQLALPDGGTVVGPINDPAEGNSVPRCDQPSAPSGIEQLWGFATQAP